jgi:hypothetical protein
MPSLEQTVEREEGKPRRFISTITYYPGDEESLRGAETVSGIPEHWDPNGQGYHKPDPDNEGIFMCVYIESFRRDDSDPTARKRHFVEVEIPGRAFRPTNL